MTGSLSIRKDPKQPQAPYEGSLEDLVFREFRGVNVQSPRQSIQDDQFAWLENIMPIAYGNAPVVQAPSSALQTLTGKAVTYAINVNISGTDYAITFSSDGSCDQVLLTSPFTVTVIAAAGKFITGVQASQWKNLGVVIIDPSSGYFDWNITAPNTLTTIDAATKGKAIAVYAGRVWVANSRTVTFTDVNSYNSFAGAGGSFIITDAYLHNAINALFPANNFLYIFGDDSIDVLSNVIVTAGVTSFTRQNITASVGTTLPNSVFAYYRSIWFSNPSGFYSLTGSTPRKMSDDLDNLVSQIDFTKPVTGSQVFVNNILCVAFLFTFNDVFTPAAASRPLLALWFRDKWWFASEGSSLNVLLSGGSAQLAGVSTLFAWDQNKLYKLFSDPTGSISSRLQTKFWDGGEPMLDKQVIQVGLGVVYSQSGNQIISVTTDNEMQSDAVGNLGQKPTIVWVNNLNQVVQWQNSLSQNVNFTLSGYVLDHQPSATGGGKYFGLTATSTFNGIDYALIAMQYKSGRPW